MAANGGPADNGGETPSMYSGIYRYNKGLSVGQEIVNLPLIEGHAHDQVLWGSDLAEAIMALGGNDTVFAGDGHDIVDGGSGDDTLYGEEGHDDLRGGSGNDSLYGGIGNDVLDGGLNSDTLAGGAGDDVYLVYDSQDTIVEGAGQGFDMVQTSLAIFTLPAHVEAARIHTTLQTGNVVLTGNALNNSIFTWIGNDLIDGGLGADQMLGSAGNDTYVVDHVGDKVFEYEGEGSDRVMTSLSTYTLPAHVEKLTYTGQDLGSADQPAFIGFGNELANQMSGGPGIDILAGGGGNDELSGGGGDDTMSGGTGNDIYLVDSLQDGVFESAGEGIDTVRSSVSGTFLNPHVENLEFFVSLTPSGQFLSDSTFTGFGNAADNRITGWSLGDTLFGMDGHDTLRGLEGSDMLRGGNGDDIHDGGTGADQMIGGAGDDTYVVDHAGDRIVEQFAEGTDTVLTTLTTLKLADVSELALFNDIENLQYTGSANFSGTGNALGNTISGSTGDDTLLGMEGDDLLYGGPGNDLLDGGTGADQMSGGNGDDWYVVDHANDSIVELAAYGYDMVTTALPLYMLPAQVERLKLTDGGSHTAYGNSMDNRIDGNGGADILFGNAGNDQINGLQGNDTLDGGVGHDTLYGGSGSDQLFGSDGADSLWGEADNDMLFGGAGNDLLYGGAGSDVFRFDYTTVQKGALDRIFDFARGSDKIDLTLIDGRAATAGDQALALVFQGAFTGNGQASVRYEWQGDSTQVQVDATGDGLMDFGIEIVGQQWFMGMADFML